MDREFTASNELERAFAELEPAWGKAALAFRTGHRLGHGQGSIRCQSFPEVHRMLAVYRTRFEGGDTMAILHAVNTCAEENVPLPEWLALAFRQQLTSFLRPGRVRSLDEVFKTKALPTRSAKRAAAVRNDWQTGGQLLAKGWEIARDDETLTSFNAVIDRLLEHERCGMAKTKVRQTIRKIEVNQSQLLGHDTSLAGFLAKRARSARVDEALAVANSEESATGIGADPGTP